MRTTILAIMLTGSLPLCLAGDPQIVISQTNGTEHIVKIKETGHMSFQPEAIHFYSATGEGPDIFNYKEIEKISIDHDGTVTGVNQISAETTVLRAFPSPATDFITVSGTGDEPVTLRIYNTAGECMVDIARYSGEKIDVSSMPSGLYLVNAGAGSTKFFKNN